MVATLPAPPPELLALARAAHLGSHAFYNPAPGVLARPILPAQTVLETGRFIRKGDRTSEL